MHLIRTQLQYVHISVGLAFHYRWNAGIELPKILSELGDRFEKRWALQNYIQKFLVRKTSSDKYWQNIIKKMPFGRF